MEKTPLLVFADDWGRHPSSCQHLVTRLKDRYKVLWVNSIGTRTPKFDRETLKRGYHKISQWFCQRSSAPAVDASSIQTINPRMWPWFTRKMDRRLNRYLLLRQLQPLIQQAGRPPVALTTIPIVADIMHELPVERWIYYCVDDFARWPGLDRSALSRMEKLVIAGADRIIAASAVLATRIRALGREATILTHGVDLDFWAQPAELPPALGRLEPPWIVYWGLLDERLESSWIRELSQRLQRGTIVLIGPEQNAAAELGRLQRVIKIGPVELSQLPGFAQAASVLIMPYASSAVTRSMQPLKLKEYLATGKPVVVSDLPACQPWSECLDRADSASQFAQWVQQRLETGLPAIQREQRVRLRDESWQAKAESFEKMLGCA